MNAFAVSLLLYLYRALGMFFVTSLDLDVLLSVSVNRPPSVAIRQELVT